MKLRIILFIIASVVLTCCKKDPDPMADFTVSYYVNLLKSGDYNYTTLPYFQPEHISELLEYREDSTIISDFPHNPISSLYSRHCRLGVYVLWTIESVRAVYIESPDHIMGFPSQNPLFGYQDSAVFIPYNDNSAHMAAADAYNDWWPGTSDPNQLNAAMQTNPLAETPYRWQ